MKKRLIQLAVLSIGGITLYFISILCDLATDNFSMAKIHSVLPYNPAWETVPLTEEGQAELDTALSQKFHYLAAGGQCFAFASDDGKYVIKFFKHKFRKPFHLYLEAPLPKFLAVKRQRNIDRFRFKLARDFNSYKIAYEDLREETGVIYIHLNKGTSLKRTVSIVDKIGIEHPISLDDIEFVVQKKAQLIYSRIEDLMESGDNAQARQSLHAILDVIVSRCKKGVFDEDPRIYRNLGFIDDKPIFIDVGRFVRDPARKKPEVYTHDLQMITKPFRCWLQEEYPSLVTTLDEELNAYQPQD